MSRNTAARIYAEQYRSDRLRRQPALPCPTLDMKHPRLPGLHTLPMALHVAVVLRMAISRENEALVK
jgi:hypothetical protein